MISSSDEDFVRAWVVSRSLREVARRMACLLTPGEARQKAALLRRCGVKLGRRPGRVAGKKPITLTPHPESDCMHLDGRGRLAVRVGPKAPVLGGRRNPVEGPWTCACCRRPASGGWFVMTGESARRFACNRCVGVVG